MDKYEKPYFRGAFAVYVGLVDGLTVVAVLDCIIFCCFSESVFCLS
jgi:hypothetical protein